MALSGSRAGRAGRHCSRRTSRSKRLRRRGWRPERRSDRTRAGNAAQPDAGLRATWPRAGKLLFSGERPTGTLASPPNSTMRAQIPEFPARRRPAYRRNRNATSRSAASKSTHRTGIDSERLGVGNVGPQAVRGPGGSPRDGDHATGGWGHINVDEDYRSDEPKDGRSASRSRSIAKPTGRSSTLRLPRSWLNDPNGLVILQWRVPSLLPTQPVRHQLGQHNLGPRGKPRSGPLAAAPQRAELPDKSWARCSPDRPSSMGENTRDFQAGERIRRSIAIYTAAGGTYPGIEGADHSHNALPSATIADGHGPSSRQTRCSEHIAAQNRDPKVVWRCLRSRWIMALFLDKEEYALFASARSERVEAAPRETLTLPRKQRVPGLLSRLPVSGRSGPTTETRWVFTGANGHYLIGRFDGQPFTAEAGPSSQTTARTTTPCRPTATFPRFKAPDTDRLDERRLLPEHAFQSADELSL